MMTNCNAFRFSPVIHSDMSADMPSRAKAKDRVNAAITMSIIIEEVRTVEIMASSSICRMPRTESLHSA